MNNHSDASSDLLNNQTWQQVMEKHAKSFFGEHVLSKKFFTQVKGLYALCRWIDDAADTAPSKEQSLANLKTILDDLRNNPSKLIPNQIYKTNRLDPGYIEDLIEGAQDDLKEVRIKDRPELIRYCYKVAGTVGLAMNDLMGVTDQKARAFAVDLGIAMQITNICRDVKEDAVNGRVYLPEDLLNKHNIKVEQLLQLRVDEESLSLAVKELLQVADQYYFSARKAYIKIPWRMRGAIITAGHLYRGIGQKLKKNDGNPFKGRTYLRKPEKAMVLGKAMGEWLTGHWRDRKLQHQRVLHEPLNRWRKLRGFNS